MYDLTVADRTVGAEDTPQRAWAALHEMLAGYVETLDGRDDVGMEHARWQYFMEQVKAASLYPWEYTAMLDAPDEKFWGVSRRN